MLKFCNCEESKLQYDEYEHPSSACYDFIPSPCPAEQPQPRIENEKWAAKCQFVI